MLPHLRPIASLMLGTAQLAAAGRGGWKTALAVGGATTAAVAGAAYYWIKGRNSDTR